MSTKGSPFTKNKKMVVCLDVDTAGQAVADFAALYDSSCAGGKGAICAAAIDWVAARPTNIHDLSFDGLEGATNHLSCFLFQLVQAQDVNALVLDHSVNLGCEEWRAKMFAIILERFAKCFFYA
jgi:hypothetical protein